VAAGSVVVAHYLHTFWTNPNAVAALTGAPALPPVQTWVTRAMDTVLPGHFFAHFGVGLFFLISGFVIPFAFINRGRMEFAIGRAFRIWPTYALGLTLAAAAYAACSAWFGTDRPFDWTTYGVQLLFIRDFFGYRAVDGIVWTLEVEAKFYLLALLLAGALRAGRLTPILAVAAVFAAISLAASQLPRWLHSPDLGYRLLYILTFNGQMVSYMLIGTAFNLFYRGTISRKLLFVSIVLLVGSVAMQWHLGTMASSFRSGMVCYLIAVAVFALAYAWRDKLIFPASLSWLADVSYPLYVVHGVAGYALMRIMLSAGFSGVVTVATATACALGLAWLLHVTVEVPTQRLGKTIAQKAVSLRKRTNRGALLAR
jgi:peptidoglycan/LPS O-acetylase OafA/YrhL